VLEELEEQLVDTTEDPTYQEDEYDPAKKYILLGGEVVEVPDDSSALAGAGEQNASA
jgi:hypothetical protein